MGKSGRAPTYLRAFSFVPENLSLTIPAIKAPFRLVDRSGLYGIAASCDRKLSGTQKGAALTGHHWLAPDFGIDLSTDRVRRLHQARSLLRMAFAFTKKRTRMVINPAPAATRRCVR